MDWTRPEYEFLTYASNEILRSTDMDSVTAPLRAAAPAVEDTDNKAFKTHQEKKNRARAVEAPHRNSTNADP